jgi:Zn finger protein HypA/HybF involved in hydrogenase expression
MRISSEKIEHACYCKYCTKIYGYTYRLDNIVFCPGCFSDELEFIDVKDKDKFIRRKRLDRITGIIK